MTKTPYGKSLWIVRCTSSIGAKLSIDVHAISAERAEICAKATAAIRWKRFGMMTSQLKLLITAKAYLIAPAKDAWSLT